MTTKTTLPRFFDLPLNKADPKLSAWGLYGKGDQLGTLNRLTENVVLEAAKEIKSGVRYIEAGLTYSITFPFIVHSKFEIQF